MALRATLQIHQVGGNSYLWIRQTDQFNQIRQSDPTNLDGMLFEYQLNPDQVILSIGQAAGRAERLMADEPPYPVVEIGRLKFNYEGPMFGYIEAVFEVPVSHITASQPVS